MRNIKNILYVVLAILVVYGSFSLVLNLWQRSTLEDQKISRENVIKVISKLESKMTRQQVFQVCKEQGWTSVGEHDGEIRLSTKPQPLPTNWIISLIFEEDKLVAIKYGTADNIRKRPVDAPPDVLFNEQ